MHKEQDLWTKKVKQSDPDYKLPGMLLRKHKISFTPKILSRKTELFQELKI